MKHRVKCTRCGWRGIRRGYYECACYDEWAYYCRPYSPGPGCPSDILWPCPRCVKEGRQIDSEVVFVGYVWE